MTEQERRILAVLGMLGVVALGIIAWQQQRPSLVVEGDPMPAQAAQWDERLAKARQVDVNTATVAELERLPDVGPALARRIVDYRASHGPFRSPEELTHVRGLGPKTYAALKDYVTTDY